jgi:ABC-2 type transport system permease protein
VRVEFVDPAADAAAEQEANEDFGISATPFQVADRYQSALVNAYFDVLVQYGGEYETLGFGDFIEVKTSTERPAGGGAAQPGIRRHARHPRRALPLPQRRRTLCADREPVTLRAYVSDAALLPDLLIAYRDAMRAEAETWRRNPAASSRSSSSSRRPNGGAEAQRIVEEWGFQPMIAALDDDREFFFYLTLEDGQQVIQLPTGNFDGGISATPSRPACAALPAALRAAWRSRCRIRPRHRCPACRRRATASLPCSNC